MGLTSIILGEVVAPTSPTEVPSPTSTTRGGLATLVSTTGGEAALLSAAPRGGVAVRVSSASTSLTTFGSGDLVQEGEAEAPRSSCGTTTVLHNNIISKQAFNNKRIRLSLQDFTSQRQESEASA
jgi:hypothetical protein